MSVLPAGLTAIAGAYLSGSVSFGYLVPRLVMKDDIRNHGSGNPGATNVARVMGARWGLLVLVLDAVKGALPVWLIPRLLTEHGTPAAMHLAVVCGVFAIVGHTFPCWLRFKGGKGVATALGVVLVLAPVSSLIAFGAFAVIFAAFRIVSLSSICAAIAFCVAQFVQLGAEAFNDDHWSLSAFSALIPALIVWRHRANIQRLMKGEEPRLTFGNREKSDAGDPDSGATATDAGES